MEIVNLNEIEEFQLSSIVKKIPILTEQLMATLVCIDKNTATAAHVHDDVDELHYVVKGSGKITVGKKKIGLSSGMLIHVPKSKSHFFSTSLKQMMVISICTLPESGPEFEKAPFAFTYVDG